MDIDKFALEIHELAVQKGWWDKERDPLVIHALIHSEIAEATEEVRNGKPLYYEGPDGKPEGVAVEIADTIIRALDYLAHLGVKPSEILAGKHAYNRGRPYRHGGKLH